jgi:hypothetical protein
LETITSQNQLVNVALAYDNRGLFRSNLDFLFTLLGLQNQNFGVFGALSATQHNLTYLLGMLAQLAQGGGIPHIQGDALETLTAIRVYCEAHALYIRGAHRIVPVAVTPDRPGAGANFGIQAANNAPNNG